VPERRSPTRPVSILIFWSSNISNVARLGSKMVGRPPRHERSAEHRSPCRTERSNAPRSNSGIQSANESWANLPQSLRTHLVGTCSTTSPSFHPVFLGREWNASLPSCEVHGANLNLPTTAPGQETGAPSEFAPHKRAGGPRASAVAHSSHVRHSNARESMAIIISPPLCLAVSFFAAGRPRGQFW
jgi:hypothetical protein